MDAETRLCQLTLVVCPEGLKITQKKLHETVYYNIPFAITATGSENSPYSPEITIFGILGQIDIRPGHVIFISDYTIAAAWNAAIGASHAIKRVDKVLIVPLDYQGAYDVLSKHSKMQSRKLGKVKTPENSPPIGEGEENTETITTIQVNTRLDNNNINLERDIRPTTQSKLLIELASIYTSGVYFSSTIDLTTSLAKQMNVVSSFTIPQRQVFLFNGNILKSVPEQLLPLTVSAIQGFASSRVINLAGDNLIIISRRSTRRIGVRYLRRGIDTDSNCANYVETEQTLATTIGPGGDNTITPNNGSLKFDRFASFTIIRGSIPVFFTQSPYKLHPTPRVISTLADESQAFERHFANLYESYGQILGINLVDGTGRERKLGQSYMRMASNNNGKNKNIGGLPQNRHNIEWFDFHKVCKGMRFDRVKEIFDTQVRDKLNQWGWTEVNYTDISTGSSTTTNQSGVLRVNCIDCLDRTNVVEMECGKLILLQQLGLNEKQNDDNNNDDYSNNHNTNNNDDDKIKLRQPILAEFHAIWADNGDAISLQYSRTPALKSDFTRLAYRTYSGILQDGIKTLTRLYSGIVPDFFTQAALEYITGNATALYQFDDCFQATDPVKLTLMEQAVKIAVSIVIGVNAEPGASDGESSHDDYQSRTSSVITDCISETNDSLTANSTYQEPSEFVGALWVQVCPPSRTDIKSDYVWGTKAQTLTPGGGPNAVNGKPVERIMILTNDAIFICEYDFNDDKILQFNQIEIKHIESIKVCHNNNKSDILNDCDGENMNNEYAASAVQVIASTCDGKSREEGFSLTLKPSEVYTYTKENAEPNDRIDYPDQFKTINCFLNNLVSKVNIDIDPTWNSEPLDKTKISNFMDKINLIWKQAIWG